MKMSLGWRMKMSSSDFMKTDAMPLYPYNLRENIKRKEGKCDERKLR
jgi:hypothetical protein